MPRQIKPQVLQDLSLCLFSAILLILSFPRANFEFLAWFGFVPVFFALNNKSRLQAFFLFFITGVIFWAGVIYWLVHVTLPGTIILILYLALYFGAFGFIIRPSTKKSTLYSLIFIPAVWVILEYIRGWLFTGFPWALLGYSQYLNLPVIQIADITGVWGVSFLVVLINVMAVEIIWSHREGLKDRLKKAFVLLVLILFLTFSYGYFCLSRQLGAEKKYSARICVVQGNIPQELKWDMSSRSLIMQRYLGLSIKALKDNPELIVWPEASLPVVLEEDPEYYEMIKNLARDAKTPLVFGGVSLREDVYYNSALLVSAEGKLLGWYDKLHLVPFGEYIPLRSAFGFLETIVPIGDFSRGKEYTVLNNPPYKFSVFICFEDLFPSLSREFVKRGADFLVNITNDAWFKKTSSPYQHLSASVFRAVENRVPLVRSANTGVSGFIAPSGKITSLVEDKSGNNIFIAGYKTQDVIIYKQGFSFYTRYGDIFIIVCLLLVLGGAVIFRKK